MTLYEVTGHVAYREHPPGAWFEATLDAGAERRAVERGHVRIIDRRTAGLRPGSWTLPNGWISRTHQEAPAGASLTRRD